MGAEAAGAEVEFLLFAVYLKRNRVDIRHPPAVGPAFRMAYVMPELGRLSTKIALQFLVPLTLNSIYSNMLSSILLTYYHSELFLTRMEMG
jgi:hypothetical protein